MASSSHYCWEEEELRRPNQSHLTSAEVLDPNPFGRNLGPLSLDFQMLKVGLIHLVVRIHLVARLLKADFVKRNLLAELE